MSDDFHVKTLENNGVLERATASRQSSSKALLAAMWDAVQILDEAPEINPVNYDHDEVCELNAAAINAYQVLMDAINAANAELRVSE